MTPHPALARLGRSVAGGLRALGTTLATPTASREPLLGHASARWVRLLPYGVAFVFTVILLPTTTQVLSHDYGLGGGWSGVLGVAQTAPLLLAVTRPLPAWWIIFGADLLGAVVLLTADGTMGRAWPWPPGMIVGYLVLCLALALRESRRTLLAVWLVTVVSSLTLGFVSPAHSEGTNVLLTVLSGAMLLLGAALRERAVAQRRLAEQETISEAERAQRTLLEERARIARELHDVVAHHMSVITVQADSAPYRIPDIPPAAAEEFGTIAATARESLTEMRRLLGVLRSENAQGERAPQPGLERLDQLVEATVRAGVPAELHVDLGSAGHERSVHESGRAQEAGPAQTVSLSAYRIVQEALANVVRHAPGATTRISVTRTGGGAGEGTGGEAGKKAADGRGDERPVRTGPDGASFLSVLIVNGPSPEPEQAPLETSGTGHGLVGMRERVRLVGGSLDVGPLPDGGFRVAARLPWHPPAGTSGQENGVTEDGGNGDRTEPSSGTRKKPVPDATEELPADTTRRKRVPHAPEHTSVEEKDTPEA
ncbi:MULTISPECIES: sensor histidine kinase [Streptomyces]|uniref:sensor histidine kinase n=1 Tax=Streptomyces TaxID=1883 RepID=UPI0004BE6F5B|nr:MULTISPECIES: sensor histidine kinase [Streptomyces]QID36204.1 sensor histidine kinase [Streptomyces albus]GHJ21801.1 two-component sensor histidine kinase [Streptomyces albus]